MGRRAGIHHRIDDERGPAPHDGVAVSRTPKNRFASEWTEATGFAAALGHRVGLKTGQPVGVIFMQSDLTGKPVANTTTLKNWIHQDDLKMTTRTSLR